MRFRSFAAALYACSFLVSPSIAQDVFTPTITVGPGGGDQMDTRGYLGFSWSLGAGEPKRPDVVIGVQRIRVKSDDNLTGVDLNARIGLDGQLARIALSGLYGSRNLYANAGVGYDFRTRDMIATVGAQTARLRTGLDYGLQARKFVPYFEVNSLAEPDAVAGSSSTLSCANGYVLTDGTGLVGIARGVYDALVGDGFDVDGSVCLDPSLIG